MRFRRSLFFIVRQSLTLRLRSAKRLLKPVVSDGRLARANSPDDDDGERRQRGKYDPPSGEPASGLAEIRSTVPSTAARNRRPSLLRRVS